MHSNARVPHHSHDPGRVVSAAIEILTNIKPQNNNKIKRDNAYTTDSISDSAKEEEEELLIEMLAEYINSSNKSSGVKTWSQLPVPIPNNINCANTFPLRQKDKDNYEVDSESEESGLLEEIYDEYKLHDFLPPLKQKLSQKPTTSTTTTKKGDSSTSSKSYSQQLDQALALILYDHTQTKDDHIYVLEKTLNWIMFIDYEFGKQHGKFLVFVLIL